ncbi:hypothetical protein B0T17DRAFT_618862 [Bombardia bombarda]|uniref:Uncharacterized protein n=1 Tax=Bombardia bombarda TaxID=252184 RepID=A0AA40BY77_9PEZI|nr:hypothetical protein B0T17DRAFT_618862 [Bombardia bombarda]
MAIPFINGSRRWRLVGIAALLTCLIIYLGFHAPLTLIQEQEPLDLQTGSGSHKHDAQQADVNVDHDTQEAEVSVDDPPTLTTTATPTVLSLTSKPTPTAESLAPKPTHKVVCSSFETLQAMKPGPLSAGKRQFPYVRPPPECRTFPLPSMEALIKRMKTLIADPDLFRLFENSYPNTLDTMVKWRGYANTTDPLTQQQVQTDEELTYVITGDIDAMWLRDSASQIYSYLPLLEPSSDADSLASLWRGLVNSHARYIVISPYCHSFQPPPESGIPPTTNGAYSQNHPNPPYNPQRVFDCKWELDSLASFLQISAAYYEKTGDLAFFGRYQWVDAVRAAVDAAAAMRTGTYDDEGRVLPSAWTFTGWTNRGSETLTNDGLGNPVRENGMVRSGFRPSDDACIFQLLTPSNMMFAAYLEQASVIMEGLAAATDSDGVEGAANLTVAMRDLAGGIRRGVARDAVVSHRDFGDIFAYEVDGYGGANLMDDANVPSLLAMPLWDYTQPLGAAHPKVFKSTHPPPPPPPFPRRGLNTTVPAAKKEKMDEVEHDYALVYQNTRKFALSMANPYYAKGPALSAVGGPHLGPGKGWPMAATVAALTAYEDLAGFPGGSKERDEAVAEQLFMVLNSTAGTGVVHETVNAWREGDWTRSWFGWANGLFGELIWRG